MTLRTKQAYRRARKFLRPPDPSLSQIIENNAPHLNSSHKPRRNLVDQPERCSELGWLNF